MVERARGAGDAPTPPNAADGKALTLPLHAEEVVVTKRRVDTLVRVTTRTTTNERQVDEMLSQVNVVVDRVSVGRIVEAVPPTREEGDVTIIPVVEEVLVVERRLMLKEEIHLRRVTTEVRHTQTVQLRTQDAIVTRLKIDDA